jgi:hypothetical protein
MYLNTKPMGKTAPIAQASVGGNFRLQKSVPGSAGDGSPG